VRTDRRHSRRGSGLASGALGALAAILVVTQTPLAEPRGATAPMASAAREPAALLAPEMLVPEAAEAADSRLETQALVDLSSDVVQISAAAEMTPPVARLARVPFHTQRDGSTYAGSNCGPAALGMVLAAWGIGQDNDYLRYLTHTYQGTWGRRGGTALEHMAQVAEDFGIGTAGLYEGDQFHQWSVVEVRAQVERGRPVIALVKYRLLPGRESSPVRYDHYVVLWDTTPTGFIYNDPIYPDAVEGYARFMTDAQLDAAMQPTLEPRQAVAFVGPIT
jgi:hypothetical protein